MRQSDAIIRAICFNLISYSSGREIGSLAVLFVGNLLHPLHGYAVELFLYGNVRHCGVWRSAVPGFNPRRNPDDVALSNLLDRASSLLNPACAVRHDQDLTERVRMPSAPRAGLERHLPSAYA
jgi:hypothetical protein